MRIINSTDNGLTFTDFDRGNVGESKSIYEFCNSKADNNVAAGGFLDIQDTEDVLLSAEMGQIKKYSEAGWIDTMHSMVGTEVEFFVIETGVNDVFDFTLEGEGPYSVTLTAGEKTASDIVTEINAVTASGIGFSAEVVSFYRMSNQDNVLPGEVEGDLGTGYGQRTEGILEGFLALVFDGIITIDGGNANSTLGFIENNFTKIG